VGLNFSPINSSTTGNPSVAAQPVCAVDPSGNPAGTTALASAGLAPVATLTVTSNTGHATTFNVSGLAPFWTGPIIGLAGANAGVAGNITANLPGSGSSRILTVQGLSTAPVSGDTFAALNLAVAKFASSGLTAQQVRDAMTMATTATPVSGSIDAQLANVTQIISTSPIQVRSLIDAGGAMTIAQGTDYPTICFGVPSSFMSLAGSTPSLEITRMMGGVAKESPLLVQPGTLQTGSLTINGTTYTSWLQFTLTASQTAALTNLNPQSYVYRVRCYWYNSATPPVITQTIEVVSQSPCTAVW
jgi:hypothetical protein